MGRGEREVMEEEDGVGRVAGGGGREVRRRGVRDNLKFYVHSVPSPLPPSSTHYHWS